MPMRFALSNRFTTYVFTHSQDSCGGHSIHCCVQILVPICNAGTYQDSVPDPKAIRKAEKYRSTRLGELGKEDDPASCRYTKGPA
jgi:hypothetical protein